ncbi:expressed unknown protein [Seminavis robusta]|uniref:Uncharacterized protein n=1 Tax=Seminavis robusta TaxID=568900 RepID=A0A9N8DS46_9STRA|nr:expressed unknown protein [Seminavis robusta]|eukprot:Sro249_g098560.1 n/a (257) ;mRNA; r:7676-8446
MALTLVETVIGDMAIMRLGVWILPKAFASLSFLVMRMPPLSGEPSADALGGNSGGSFHQSRPTLTEDTDLGLELVPVKLISQTLPQIGLPALPETVMPETQDPGVVLPGAIPFDGTFDGMDDDDQARGLIDAVVTHTNWDNDVDQADNLIEPRMSSQRSKRFWRNRLLRVLCMEVNVVFLAVIAVLLAFLVVSEVGGNGNNNTASKSMAINTPSNNSTAPINTTSLLDSLNLPDYNDGCSWRRQVAPKDGTGVDLE